MLVIDESTSITSHNMTVIQRFVERLIAAYRVSAIESNIGLIRFSTSARTRVDIPVNRFTDREELLEAVRAINFAERGRGNETHHKEAIQLATRELQNNGRRDASDFIIFVTDGHPEPASQSARTVAATAKAANISIYGIYIGGNETEVAEVTAVSSPGRVFPIANFDALNNVLDDVIRRNCTCKIT